MVTGRCVAIARDSEVRLKRKARLHCSPRLIHLTEIRKGEGEIEGRKGIVSVGLDGPPQPYSRLSVGPLPHLGDTGITHPHVYSTVAGRETKRLANMGFGFGALTNKIFHHADARVRIGQVSIQHQRPFAFSHALSHSVRESEDAA